MSDKMARRIQNHFSVYVRRSFNVTDVQQICDVDAATALCEDDDAREREDANAVRL
jgi:hypothetical protein